ncbi:MAG: hypothetical protein FJW38_02120 [Acidobacteria bacterium]|nr:hypothetical protein [Acidobacteriota bacterium]
MNDKELDLILDSMKDEAASADVAAAQARVWQKLNPCGQFREQFDAYKSGSLSEAKRLLIDDHLTRCADCRRALRVSEAPAQEKVIAMPARRQFNVPRWAIAAGLAAAAIFAGRDRLDIWLAPSGPRATVKQLDGTLYAHDASILKTGAALNEGQLVRTGGGTRAVIELADGSLMEVNERTELYINSAWSGQTVRLQRGDVIVRAAKQRRGSLRVITRDAEASVKGTIFTVSAGTAGSLVGVVEGSVAVTQSGGEKLLKPGERTATSIALEKVSVRDAVQWSSEKEKHIALLGELAVIEKQLSPVTARVAASMISRLPDQTQFYAAMPNLGPSLDQAVGLIEQRSRQVDVLKEWWTSSRSGEMRQTVEQLRSLSSMLGEEIVFVLAKPEIPAALAEVKAGQEAALQAKLTELLPAPAKFKIVNGVLVVSQGEAKLAQILARLGKGAGTPFANELSRRYARGVAWIFGADLKTIPQRLQAGEKAKFFGADNARFVFVEQRAVNGVEENEGSLIFAGPRKGVASWIAAPGSSGSAEYLTSDAVVAFSAATRNPKQIFEEIQTMFGSELVNDIEARVGVSISGDLAASLGTDFTIAVETPSVPIPGWILAYEAYRPEQISATFKRVADAYNASLTPEEVGRKLTYKTETESGRAWYSLSIGGEMLGLHWTFDRGYWLLGMDRGTLARAIQTRAGGFPLIRSEAFRAQTPALAGAHASGFLWMNMAGASQVPGLSQYVKVDETSLLTFSGEAERIQAASRTRIAGVLLDVLMNAGANPKALRKTKVKKPA